VGDDKPGIVRRFARCCADRGVNIDDVWNEVRDGRFITIFHVTLPRDLDAKDFRYGLETTAGELGIALTLQHQDIFTATNSLEVHTGRRKR
jgi:predicted amino acid-binding ACT domain protein